jgi:putative restriction endonuclease
MNTDDYWYKKLATLRVDRASKNPAPHKPLMLLAIIDQIEEGVITSNKIKLTSELAFRFLGYWELVSHRGRGIGRAELPFFYLQSDGFLKHVAALGLEAVFNSIRVTSVESLNKVIAYSEIPEEFFVLMQHSECRAEARKTLIEGNWFFPEEQVKLLAVLNLNPSDFFVDKDTKNIANKHDIKQGRDIKFRFQIIPLYRFACALCENKVLLPSGVTLVEAAHIHQFAYSKNDNVSNGMALCRNHHWAFDQGLWSINQDFKIVVACGAFTEQAINQPSLESYHTKE